jgi:hypothetical protein
MTSELLLLFTFLQKSNVPATLPCTDSTPACIERVVDLAILERPELVVLDNSIALQKRKLWTTWISTDGLHPVTIAFRIARNLAGGGDHAALMLEISRLEVRRAELVSQIRESVTRRLIDLDQVKLERDQLAERVRFTAARNRAFEISFASGQESTPAMIQLWLQERELKLELGRAESRVLEKRLELEEYVLGRQMTHKP